jgi:hypothetical protein
MSWLAGFMVGVYFSTVFAIGWQQRSPAVIGITTILGVFGLIGEMSESGWVPLTHFSRDLIGLLIFAAGTVVIYWRAEPESKVWPWNWKWDNFSA